MTIIKIKSYNVVQVCKMEVGKFMSLISSSCAIQSHYEVSGVKDRGSFLDARAEVIWFREVITTSISLLLRLEFMVH